MKYFVYIIQSEKNGKLYIGQTHDLDKRLKAHNAGYSTFTKKYRPWKLYAYRECDTRTAALAFERKLKNLKARSRLDHFILKHDFIITD